jgi:MoaA/NifB/PqqE/SkfB family radical SAM enzyme
MKEANHWHKSPHLLMYPMRPGSGWEIRHRINRSLIRFPDEHKTLWDSWNITQLEHVDPHLFEILKQNSMITPYTFHTKLTESPLDYAIPSVSERFVKYYKESTETIILYNSILMSENNPLLVLGPYGSMCWNLLAQKKSVGEMRSEAVRIFGVDEVFPFLRRLIHLGFLVQMPFREVWDRNSAEVITKEFPANLVQHELPRTSVPWYVLWEICTQCDLRCRTCYLPHFDSMGVPRQNLMARAAELVEANVFYVSLFGGEVLLRDDLEDLIMYLRSRDVFVKIISNGQLLTPERARKLSEAGLNQLEISFDGFTDEVNDASRGNGSFRMSCNAVKIAQDAGIRRQGIVWTVHSDNYIQVDMLPEFLFMLGVTECYISSFKMTGLNGSQAPWKPLDSAQLSELKAKVSVLSKKHSNLVVTLMSECSCGRSSAVISYDEKVRLCTFSSESIGTLQEETFPAIWKKLDDICLGEGPHGFCRAQLYE